MKTKLEIRHRAKKVALSYLKKRIALETSPYPQNCVYNYEVPINGKYEGSRISEVSVSPRKSVSLVVIQPQKPVRVCTYSTQKGVWDGDRICDSEDVSKFCNWFKPAVTAKEIFESFNAELEDDEITRLRYPDLAALQWVLEDRFYNKISYPFLYVWAHIMRLRFRWFKTNKVSDPLLPGDVWDESDTKNS